MLCFSYTHSSFGWEPEAKKEELFDRLSRFVLVHRGVDENDISGASSSDPKSPDILPLVAYTMFRFDEEEGDNVVYWFAFVSQGHTLSNVLSRRITVTSYKYPSPRNV